MAMFPSSPLNRTRVLVLNAGYEPVKIICWQRAMLLWLAEKVDVLDHHAREVRSVSCCFLVPSVVRIRQYVRPKKLRQSIAFSRTHIFVRDQGCCQYCGDKFPTKELTLDHVVPATRGGPRSWENLVTSCQECNQRKGSRTPEEANMPLLRKPSKLPLNYLPDILLLRKQVPESWKIYLGDLLAS
jgi:5-methylcytosine-specific restriction endonuclease McrA